MVGVELNDFGDVVFALIIGAVYVLSALFLPAVLPFTSAFFALGVPQVVGFSLGFSLFIVVFVAPILEETVFRGVIPEILQNIFGFGQTIVALVSAAIFSFFHFFVFTQGNYFSVVSPFIGAFVFGIIAFVVVQNRNSLIPAMILHAIVNAFLTFRSVAI